MKRIAIGRPDCRGLAAAQDRRPGDQLVFLGVYVEFATLTWMASRSYTRRSV
jgi:hypothetical protein